MPYPYFPTFPRFPGLPLAIAIWLLLGNLFWLSPHSLLSLSVIKRSHIPNFPHTSLLTNDEAQRFLPSSQKTYATPHTPLPVIPQFHSSYSELNNSPWLFVHEHTTRTCKHTVTARSLITYKPPVRLWLGVAFASKLCPFK